MKSLTTVIVLSLSCASVNFAAAEPFNNRSPEWSAISSNNAALAGSENRQTLAGAGFNAVHYTHLERQDRRPHLVR